MTRQQNLEIGNSIQTGSIMTNYHDVGSGEPTLLLHGSGPGVSAWAEWSLTIHSLKNDCRMLAPDLAGFGFSQTPSDIVYSRQLWIGQIVAFLDVLGVEKVNIIGNAFGGSIALAMAIHHPERVNRLILMGSAGVSFELTPGLDAVWGYEPTEENMRAIMRVFADDQRLVGDDLVRMRYRASKRAGVQDAYSSMFPAPRQRWIEAMAHPEADIRGIPHKTLLIHGRDDKIIPLSTSLTLQQWIDDSQLHVYGRCGHWTQIEQAVGFAQQVMNFLQSA